MTCSDWEQEIAGESVSAVLAEHLQTCERCREFSRELEENRAALRSLEMHPAAFDAVRRRVLDEIRTSNARTAWWPRLAAAAASIVLVCVSFVIPWRKPAPQTVAHVSSQVAARAVLPASPMKPAHTAMRGRNHSHHVAMQAVAARRTEPLVVKMLTDDPDVIIIWLVDQEGDSL